MQHVRRAFGGRPADPCPAPDQVAALIWCSKGDDAEVLLITSRGTGRWILPKGWIEEDESLAAAAAREAWEEAGIEADTNSATRIGSYSYDKIDQDGTAHPLQVGVFAMSLERQANQWPEKGQRDRKWVSCTAAASMVEEPGLQAILIEFGAGWRKLAA